MSPLGITILSILAIMVLLAPRRWALFAIMACVLCLTRGDALDLFGVNLFPTRILEVIALFRVISRKELASIEPNGLDRSVFLAYGFATTVFLVRTALGYGTSASVAQVTTADKIGLLMDVALWYLVFRALLSSVPDLVWLLRGLVWLLIPFVALVVIERTTGQNPFAAVGGQPTVWIEAGGRTRCYGSFMHPSLLGTVGASLLPWYFSLLLTPGNKSQAIAGIGLCLAIVLLANSGGPVIVVGVGAVAWLLWFFRKKMKLFRFSVIAALALLALAMKAPLWYLPDKLSLIFGGDGWHRSYLMNQAIDHFELWWLVGMPLELAQDWFPYRVMGTVDITNLYLAFGLDAGILAIVLFLYIFVRAFSALGIALSKCRDNKGLLPDELIFWGLGAALAGHAANFLAITYFDQTFVVWLLGLAAISSLTSGRVADVTSGSLRHHLIRPNAVGLHFTTRQGSAASHGPRRPTTPRSRRPRP